MTGERLPIPMTTPHNETLTPTFVRGRRPSWVALARPIVVGSRPKGREAQLARDLGEFRAGGLRRCGASAVTG